MYVFEDLGLVSFFRVFTRARSDELQLLIHFPIHIQDDGVSLSLRTYAEAPPSD